MFLLKIKERGKTEKRIEEKEDRENLPSIHSSNACNSQAWAGIPELSLGLQHG